MRLRAERLHRQAASQMGERMNAHNGSNGSNGPRAWTTSWPGPGAVRRHELHRGAPQWKEAEPGRKVIGYMPIYVPRELIHAAGALPLGIVGGGDQMDVIHGDAYYQSYICRIPRSTIELGSAAGSTSSTACCSRRSAT
jgi:hypothetical protein